MSNFTQPSVAARNLRAAQGVGTLARDTDQVDTATLARGIINPATGEVGAFIDANGNLVGAGSGGITPSAGIAYIKTAGDDETGAVGDPSRPYSTIQAAYDDGARTFVLGIGSFGDLTISGNNYLWFVGYGSWMQVGIPADVANSGGTQIGTITMTDSAINYMQDVHGHSVYIDAVVSIGANGANGESGQTGENGESPGTLYFRNLEIGTITMTGGIGGAGGTGDTDGGAGGQGGSAILRGTIVVDAINLIGGAGGEPSGSGTGGTGGTGGSATIDGQSVIEDVSTAGGAGGTGGSSGSDGTVTAAFSTLVNAPTGAGTYSRVAVVEAGVFQAL